jgi:hypothetical protein
MWYALRRNAQRDYGVTLRITPGKNAYRDMAGQAFARKNACAAGNCNSAAVEGTSSHGGTWKDAVYTNGVEVDAMAFDVDNWRDLAPAPTGNDAVDARNEALAVARFFAEARAVGFLCDGIRVAVAGHREVWHIIVLVPWGPVPASLDSHPISEEDDVKLTSTAVKRKNTQTIDNKDRYVYLDDAGHVSVINGPVKAAWGALYVSLSTVKPGTGDTAVAQIRAVIETVDAKGTLVSSSSLGSVEIIGTAGQSSGFVTVPPVPIGEGQHLRFKAISNGGAVMKITAAVFRGVTTEG